ncbi:TerB family tellurite resistance protein [Hydrogenophaga sp.]|uniref:tellurite resistance TerB family protein n=1 Tax=Hydrogenophaga sp. TaxID=1904254 RepID=UPI0035AFDB7A
MKAYSVNSPEAAARVLAMAMLADGQYSMTEIRSLDRQNAPARLGLTPEAFKAVVDDFCQDLLVAGGGQWTGTVDPAVRDQLMGEIDDRALQDLILLQCETLMLADGHLADGEVELLDALSAAWRRPVLV